MRELRSVEAAVEIQHLSGLSCEEASVGIARLGTQLERDVRHEALKQKFLKQEVGCGARPLSLSIRFPKPRVDSQVSSAPKSVFFSCDPLQEAERALDFQEIDV